MILGRELAEIENSYLRVMRMIVLMKTGGDAFADRINAFNIMMNLGNRIALWFTGEYGGTLCRAITGTDFSSPAGVRRDRREGRNQSRADPYRGPCRLNARERPGRRLISDRTFVSSIGRLKKRRKCRRFSLSRRWL